MGTMNLVEKRQRCSWPNRLSLPTKSAGKGRNRTDLGLLLFVKVFKKLSYQAVMTMIIVLSVLTIHVSKGIFQKIS